MIPALSRQAIWTPLCLSSTVCRWGLVQHGLKAAHTPAQKQAKLFTAGCTCDKVLFSGACAACAEVQGCRQKTDRLVTQEHKVWQPWSSSWHLTRAELCRSALLLTQSC